jgi:UDP-glucose 4-epimerase
MLACSAPLERVAGQVFNVACGERHTINELVESLKKMLGREIDPVHTRAREGDVRDSLADITLARNGLGYEPSVRFAEGLRLTVEWFREKRSREKP